MVLKIVYFVKSPDEFKCVLCISKLVNFQAQIHKRVRKKNVGNLCAQPLKAFFFFFFFLPF